MIDSKTLKAIVKIATKHRVKRLKTTEFEIELFEFVEAANGRLALKPYDSPKLVSVEGSDPMPTDEEMLYWSTGFTPEKKKDGVN